MHDGWYGVTEPHQMVLALTAPMMAGALRNALPMDETLNRAHAEAPSMPPAFLGR